MKIRYLSCLLIPAACATVSGPLADFEPVEATTVLDAPAARTAGADAGRIEHGRYLVGLLGCESCHTDGALLGTPRMDRQLAGSDVGIAFSNPLQQRRPGIVYPANLTPDMKTGIGAWSEREIITAIRTGVGRDGRRHLPVMPWPGYQKLSDADAAAIAAYLRALPPVQHAVPENVRPGERARAPYVHFGVYQSRR
ncbi:MAG: c-type cytochrome [Gammaproteobacteria bacterium]|nr:c-type cytochrome [Gammaproteobacteria bacterium]